MRGERLVRDKKMRLNRYEDIIDLQYRGSVARPRMPRIARAAQFAPFAALTGYEAAIKETARLTQERVELDESRKSVLNERLRLIMERRGEQPEVTITYFVPDERKAGGAYMSITGQVRNMNQYKGVVVMEDKTEIPVEQIYEIGSDLFDQIAATEC